MVGMGRLGNALRVGLPSAPSAAWAGLSLPQLVGPDPWELLSPQALPGQ